MYRRVVTGGLLLNGFEPALMTRPQVRHWKSNPMKIRYRDLKPKVDVKYLDINEPVSGSLNYGDMGQMRKFLWNAESMNTRGFLRFQKEYDPPGDAEQQVLELSKSLIPELNKMNNKDVMEFELSDVAMKFQLLSKAFSQFNHSVPNSMLYMMNNIGDVVEFYTTKIKTTTPFDELVRRQDELPPNLHVQKEPIRFHPETDTMFGGLTAFPKSSTIVTGLRAKKKYKGFEAKKSWP